MALKQHLSEFIMKYKVKILLILGIIIGSLYANICVKYLNVAPDVYTQDTFMVYEELAVDSVGLWIYVLSIRVRVFVAIVVLSFTNLKKFAIYGYLLYFGIVSGAMISYAVMNFGIAGVWVYIVSNFPQYILYIIAYVCLYKMCITNSTLLSKKDYVFMIAFIMVLVISGTYLESYVNPFIITMGY